MLLLLAGLIGGAWAQDAGAGAPAGPSLSVHGDLKSFTLLTLPYDNPDLEALGAWPEDPQGQAILDGRLRLRADLGGSWRIEAHHAVSTVVGSAFTLGTTGAAATAPELVDLTWTVPEEGATGTTVQGRTDRLLVQGEAGPLTLALGRQPVSFGAGRFFTPLDLVSPFFPGTIDSEYKPGVDAARLDAYAGLRGQWTVVAAWVGDCSLALGPQDQACEQAGVEDLALASWTRLTVGVSDLALFLAEVHDDEVVGLSVVSGVGPVGLYGDASLTLPPGHLDARAPTEDPFVRAAVGADWRPGGRTTLSAEAYLQTNGSADPADHLAQYAGARYLRGELWAAGRGYLALSLAQELRPTLQGSLALLTNVEEPSALLLPGLSASLADDVELTAGAYVGLGRRPEGLALRSELGFVPVTAYSRLAAWF